MPDENDLSGKVGLDTTSFKTGVSELTAQIKSIETSFRASAAVMGEWSSSTDGLTQRTSSLTEKLDLQKQKLNLLHAEYTKAVEEQGASSKAVESLANQMYSAEKAISSTEADIKKYNATLQSMKSEEAGAETATKNMGSELNTAKEKALSFGDVLKANVFGSAITSGLQSLANSMKEVMSNALESADGIQRMSDATGMSAQQIQEWQYVGDDLGVSIDTITGAQAKLTKSMEAARNGTKAQSDAFTELGISVRDNNGGLRDAKEVMTEAFGALKNVGNETERDALSMIIFGKSAQDLNPLIKAGTAEIKKLSDQAEDTGAVMSNQTVGALHDFNNEVKDMKASVEGAAGSMLAKLLPSLQPLIEKVKNIDLTPITNVLKWIIDNAGPITAALAGIGAGIAAFKITSAIQGAVAAWTVYKTATEAAAVAQGELDVAMDANPIGLIVIAVAAAVAGLVLLAENMDKVDEIMSDSLQGWEEIGADVGNWFSGPFVNLFTNSWNGITGVYNSADTWLGDKFADAENGVEDAWRYAVDFFRDTGNGIIGAFTGIGTRIKNTFTDGINFILGLPDKAYQWGKDMVDSFTGGITDEIGQVEAAVKGVADTVSSYLHFSVPDTGPLADFQSWMPDFMSGLAGGMTDNIGKIKNAASGISSTISVAANPVSTFGNSGNSNNADSTNAIISALSTLSAKTSFATGEKKPTSGSSTPIVINLISQLDGRSIASATYKYNLVLDALKGPRLINEVV